METLTPCISACREKIAMGQRVGRCYTCVEEIRQQLAACEAQRDLLRAALVKLVGADGREELGQMEAVMRLLPAPAQDKADTIDAIHALIATAN